MCANGATCVDLVQDYSCTCASGFTGEFCDTGKPWSRQSKRCIAAWLVQSGARASAAILLTPSPNDSPPRADINECLSSPCQNGGNCTNFFGSFDCSCSAGFHGQLCDSGTSMKAVVPAPGQSDAGPLSGSFSLPLNDATSDINECSPNPCENGGTCSEGDPGEFVCNCLDTWTGPTCEEGKLWVTERL